MAQTNQPPPGPAGARRPAVDEPLAGRLAGEHFGLRAEVHELRSERDRNFKLEAVTHGGFVLKITLASEGRRALEAQNAAIGHLSGVDPGLGLPVLRTSTEGADIVEVVDSEGRPCLARLLTFVEGHLLGDLASDERAAFRPEVGRVSARIRTGLEGFRHPGACRETTWDLARVTTEVVARAGEIEDPVRRRLVDEALEDFREDALPLCSHLAVQVIHNDLNDHNLVVSDGGLAVIDFGDLVESYGIAELAVAGTYAVLESAMPVKALAEVVSGYSEVRDLAPLEADVLLQLVRMRLCLSVCMSAQQSRMEPDNPYLTVSQGGAWQALEQLSVTDFQRSTDALREAAGLRRHGLVPRTRRRDPDELRAVRHRMLSTSLSLSYDNPLHIVRGYGQYLYDERGRPYLDCVNNVAHVGHSHPRVVEAAHRQMRLLNTNTRYLHELRAAYVERLTSTLPPPLSVCWLVCSGTEANELALRLARAATGRFDVAVLDVAYHGNSSAMVDLSPYKHAGPGGSGCPEYVHVAPLPDPYRGLHRDRATAGEQYAAAVDESLARAESRGGAAAFFAEALPSCGGQIVPPSEFLAAAFARVRARGALSVSDEVQTGFGRVGSHFWAFECSGAHPDIVTMGKPIGNGHPMGAVVTTPETARAFENGMEYFNSFGGNPVSCAVGLAVLDVIDEERLQQNAERVGMYLRERLADLADRHEAVGDVRGEGLFIGVDLVRDRASREPDTGLARRIVNRLRERGVLLSSDGRAHNVLKIKPPLCFTAENANELIAELERALGEG